MRLSINATEIETRLASYFNYRANIIVPNISWGVNLHECDLLVIRKSGYGIEIEIKVSKSDLKADAKKEHHHIDRQGRISELYFAIPEYLEGCIEYIPEQAGVLILSKTVWGLQCHRKRKAIVNKTRRKFTDDEMLKIAHLGTMRIWNLKRQIKRQSSYYLNKLKKKNEDTKQLKLVI